MNYRFYASNPIDSLSSASSPASASSDPDQPVLLVPTFTVDAANADLPITTHFPFFSSTVESGSTLPNLTTDSWTAFDPTARTGTLLEIASDPASSPAPSSSPGSDLSPSYDPTNYVIATLEQNLSTASYLIDLTDETQDSTRTGHSAASDLSIALTASFGTTSSPDTDSNPTSDLALDPASYSFYNETRTKRYSSNVYSVEEVRANKAFTPDWKYRRSNCNAWISFIIETPKNRT